MKKWRDELILQFIKCSENLKDKNSFDKCRKQLASMQLTQYNLQLLTQLVNALSRDAKNLEVQGLKKYIIEKFRYGCYE